MFELFFDFIFQRSFTLILEAKRHQDTHEDLAQFPFQSLDDLTGSNGEIEFFRNFFS